MHVNVYLPSNGSQKNNIYLLDLGPARPLNPSNLNNKYSCHEGSRGGGCFSGCCQKGYIRQSFLIVVFVYALMVQNRNGYVCVPSFDLYTLSFEFACRQAQARLI